MKLLITFICLFPLCTLNSQVAQSLIYNNAGARINDNGIFFTNLSLNQGGYQVPNGANRNLIYSSAFWFGGKDINGQLKLAAQDIYNQGSDLWGGALTADGTASYVNPNPLGQNLWGVNTFLINDHIANYSQQGYVISPYIANWPAHGDAASNQSEYLAPFVDVDMNGVYEPELGDYPCIKGGSAIYVIMNDKGGVHYSGGDALGIEVHFMFYQLASGDDLNNTTFVDVKIYNRSSETIYDFATSFMMDGDLGGYVDDFVGVDTTLNLGYQYNGDDNDADVTGMLGYGANPPSFGVMCLNDTLDSFGVFGSTNQPNTVTEKYNVMMGLNPNGSTKLDGNLNPTKFQYYDNPNDPLGWSENSVGNIKGERSSIMTIMKDELMPFESVEYSYAIIYSRAGSDNLDNVDRLFETAAFIQDTYNQSIHDLCESTLGLADNNDVHLEIFPNPSNGSFKVDLKGNESSYIVIYDMTGKEIYKENLDGKNIPIQLNCETGMYIVKVVSNDQVWSKKITIN